jgi:hypothetical protein
LCDGSHLYISEDLEGGVIGYTQRANEYIAHMNLSLFEGEPMSKLTTAYPIACFIVAGIMLQNASAQEVSLQAEPEGDEIERQSVSSGTKVGSKHDEPDSKSANGIFNDEKWKFDFNSWAWMARVSGDVGVGDVTVDVDAGFKDILDASDSLLAFSGRLEFTKGKWGGYVDAFYMNLGADDRSASGFPDTDISTELIVLDAGVSYRLGEWIPAGEAEHNLRNTSLDLYAGVRYTSYEVEFQPDGLSTREQSGDLFDPVIGLRFEKPINEKWHFNSNADIGGFGIGSDFAWAITGVLGYDCSIFESPATVYFGYRAIGWDYSNDSGANKIEWDIIMHGPILGLSIKF